MDIRCLPLIIVAGAGVAGLTSAASAEIVTHQFELTEAPLGIFGNQFTTDYVVPSNEVIGGEIVDARMHLEFNTENDLGSMDDAADLQIEFQPPVQGLPFWEVSGADLGWSGTGQFTGDISTDELNLPIIDLPPDSLSLWFVRIISLNESDPSLGGQFTNSYIELGIDFIPAPPAFAALGLLALTLHKRRRR